MTFALWLQSRLTSHGFSVGVIDGIVGPKTIAALRAFQGKVGLPATGVSNPATVEALRGTSTGSIQRPTPGMPALRQPIGKPAPKPTWPRQDAVQGFYGAVGTDQAPLALPYPMKLAWNKSVTVTRITLHKKVHESAGRAFEQIALAYNSAQRIELGIDLFGGSLNVRKMRGGSAYSMHSWGIAIDFDPERNQLNWGRDKARLAKPDAEAFWRAWESEGWVALGRDRNFDWMHVQAARL